MYTAAEETKPVLKYNNYGQFNKVISYLLQNGFCLLNIVLISYLYISLCHLTNSITGVIFLAKIVGQTHLRSLSILLL